MDGKSGAAHWVAAGLEAARRAVWFPAVVFAAHVAASRAFSAYESFPPLDIPMHIAGGFATAFFFHVSLDVFARRRLIRDPDPVIRSVLEDTLFDMLLGMVGGVIFVLVVAVKVRKKGAP